MSSYSRDELRVLYDTLDKVVYKSELYNFLVNNTTDIINIAKLFPKQRMWHIINDTIESPQCPICGNVVKWDDALPFKLQKYREYCSNRCSRKSDTVTEKKKQTESKRSVEDNQHIIEKRKATNLQKYGVESATKLDSVQQKRIQTVQDRYGVDNVIQNNHVLEKRKQTNRELFGVDAPAQSDEIKQKMRDVAISKYGRLPSQLQLSDIAYNSLLDREWLYDQHITKGLKMMEIAESLDVHQATVLRYLKYHNISVKYYSNSLMEEDLVEWLKLSCDNVITNSRQIITPKELDVYLPDYKIAIEFDGIYWHSELQGKDSNYHLKKTLACAEQGIRLIHVFENEWISKQDIVKSRLLSILNKNGKIYARKCEIRSLKHQEYTEFFEMTHIQGSVNASICYGLFYNNELVAAMSWSNSRFNANCEYELLRFSNKLNTNVIGGASKLFAHFINNHSPSSIISYSDIRWNTGNVYQQLGFEFQYNAKPNYFYFHSSDYLTLCSRHQFQKHKLPNKLESFDSELTEWENMVQNGFDRIWDCGNSVWIWLHKG